MKLFATHDDRMAVLERKVGLFAFAGLGALLLLFVVVAVEQGMFASTTKFRFQTNDAGMIHEGMEVRLSGFKVGKLLDISLKDDGAVEVQFFVNNKYLLNVRHGAKVRLVEQGLFGGGILEIVPGPKDQPGLEINELLPFERKLGLSELAHDLVERIKPILDNVQLATASLNASDGLINHVKQVTVKFEKTGQDISLLADQSRDAVAELNQNVGKTLNSFRDVALDAGKVTASSVESIPAMLQDGRAAAEDARSIISSTKDSWPVKNMMAPGEMKILPMDSYGVINAQPE